MSSKVLVVDDEPCYRSVVGEILRASGYAVLFAAGVAEALAVAEAERPEIVLTDLMMPETDGLTLIRRLRALRTSPSTRVIVASAKATREDIALARAAGADDYLVKPFSASDLRQILGNGKAAAA